MRLANLADRDLAGFVIREDGTLIHPDGRESKGYPVGNNGYLGAKLRRSIFGRGIVRVLIHRLVAEAFLERPEGYKFVAHKDGDVTNNHVDNLEWRKGHAPDRVVTEAHAEFIDKHRKIWTVNRIAQHVGLSYSTVKRIIHRLEGFDQRPAPYNLPIQRIENSEL